jgi:hypothetical protein
MNKTEFAHQSDCEKITEISKYGTYLEYIIKGPYMVKLYQYENFYVETYFHIQKDRIDSISSFDNTNKLTPYLKKIKLIIPPLFKKVKIDVVTTQKKYCLDCPELACPENFINKKRKGKITLIK